MNRARRWLLGFLSLVALGLLLAWWAEVYTDYLWYRHDAYPIVFWRQLQAQAAIFAAVVPALYGLLRYNLKRAAAHHGLMPAADDERAELAAQLDSMSAPTARWLPPVAAVLGGLLAMRSWQSWLLVFGGIPFGLRDPAFGQEVGFYVYRLGALQGLLSTLNTWLLATAAVTTLLYVSRGGIRLNAGEVGFDRAPRAHLLAFAAALLVVRALLLWLRRYQLAVTGGALLPGAGWTDLHVRAPALAVSASLAFAAAAICWLARRPGWSAKPAYWAIGVHVGSHLLLAGLVPGLAQRALVRPNEFDRERPYIERAIGFTRRAFNLDQVEVSEAQLTDQPSASDLSAASGTLSNVRVWDHRPLLRTFKQIQEIRQYYDIVDVDTDRYVIDGKLRQVLISAREMNAAQLDAKARSWVNQHLEYTHGYGLVASLASDAEADGRPVLLSRDLPVRSVPALSTSQPRLYFGEVILVADEPVATGLTLPGAAATATVGVDEAAERWRRRLNDTGEPAPDDYLLVGGERDEFDYPESIGQQDIRHRNRYEGRSGVPVGGFWRRLAYAVRMRSVELALTRFATEESKLLLYRQVTRRCKKAAPFLIWDTSPYPAVVEGRIKWICEGYTVSQSYPYSEMHVERQITPRGWRLTPTWNYLRNPVKAVVDAYDGTVDFYVVDDQDPLCRTWARLYTGVLKPAKAASEALRAHFRYPQLLFRSQADIFQRYHMTDPRQFYAAEDLWATARQFDRSAAPSSVRRRADREAPDSYQPMEPYYIQMALPAEQEEQFMLLNAYTPYSARDQSPRDNMISYLVGLCDGPRYGQLRAYKFPPGQTTYGPLQVEALIDQDETISALLTLWNKSGSQVVRGHLLVVPVASTLLYVQPLYLEAEQKGLPELKRVVVVHGRQVVLGESFSEAMAQLFGDGWRGGSSVATPVNPVPPPPPGGGTAPPPQPSTVHAAQRAFDDWDQAVRRGDWSAAQSARDRLSQLLRDLAGDR